MFLFWFYFRACHWNMKIYTLDRLFYWSRAKLSMDLPHWHYINLIIHCKLLANFEGMYDRSRVTINIKKYWRTIGSHRSIKLWSRSLPSDKGLLKLSWIFIMRLWSVNGWKLECSGDTPRLWNLNYMLVLIILFCYFWCKFVYSWGWF